MSCSATFCHLAGVSAVDQKAAASTPPLPPIDSLNVWDLISGANATSPRREWALTPFGEDTSMGPINRDDPHGGDAAYMLWPHMPQPRQVAATQYSVNLAIYRPWAL